MTLIHYEIPPLTWDFSVTLLYPQEVNSVCVSDSFPDKEGRDTMSTRSSCARPALQKDDGQDWDLSP